MTERIVGFDHTDPMTLPFVEVSAKIARELLHEARDRGDAPSAIIADVVDTATGDASTIARDMADRLAGGRRLPLACTAGCAHCCHSTVHASAAEILRIAGWLKANRSEEELANLRARAEDAATKIAPLGLSPRVAAKIPCPLLDGATSACTVYDVRPIACRAYHSGDVEPCKRALERGEANPVLPIDPPLFHVAHAHAFGLMTACVAEGLDVGPYDLAVALPKALEADLDARWLAGESVLPHSPLSREHQPAYAQVIGALARDLDAGRLDAVEKIATRLDPEARRKERNRRKRDKRNR